MIHITDTVALDEREISERFVRTIGPRNLNANRDATGVELRVDIARSSLPKDVQERLIAIGGRRVTSKGVLIVVGRADRSQVHNRSAAHARLIELVARAATPPSKRRPTKLDAAARENRKVAKERRSAVKRSRTRTDEE